MEDKFYYDCTYDVTSLDTKAATYSKIALNILKWIKKANWNWTTVYLGRIESTKLESGQDFKANPTFKNISLEF